MYVEKEGWAGVESLAQSPACRMDTKEMPDTKVAYTAAPQRVLKDVCAFAILKNFPHPGRNNLGTYGHVLPIVTQKKNKEYIQIKDWAKITIRAKFYMNLRQKMTWSIHLTTRCWNKNSSMTLKKKVLIINA